MSKSKIVGIDLGTTFSAIAVLNDSGRPEVLSNFETNQKITPSVVYIKPGESSAIVGEKAINFYKSEPNNVISATKKQMENEAVWSLQEGKFISKNTAEIGDGEYTPAQISSFILSKVKELNEDTSDVVITVPAMFADTARTATLDAAKLADLNVIELINEPTAAILHYASMPDIDVSGKIMVFDLGGGTFDVTLAEVNDKDVEILNSRGDKNLGGHDFDELIIEDINKEYSKEKGGSLTNKEKRQFFPLAEQIKKTLSVKNEASGFIDGNAGPFEYKLTRDKFNILIDGPLSKIKMLIESVLDTKNFKNSDISKILLVGGSTRIPIISKIIEDLMGKPPTKGVDVDEAVACGAAIYAGLNANPDSLSESQQKILNNVHMQDVTNHYLGTKVVTYDDEREIAEVTNKIIIHRDTKLPTSYTDIVYTMYDGQEAVECAVTQSDQPEESLEFVNVLASKELKLPPNRPAGQKIEITYSYDKGGKVHCVFTDVESNKQVEIDVRPESSLNLDDAKLDFQID